MVSKQQDREGSLSPKQKWEVIPQEFREKIIQNVWCNNCRDVVTIVDYRVYSARPDIVLRGRCGTCDSDVARVVEHE